MDPNSRMLAMGAGGPVTPPSTEELYTTPGTYTWICPPGVTSVSVVCIGGGGRSAGYGGGGGGGGALSYRNNYSVTPGQSYTVEVGDQSVGGSGDYFTYNATRSAFGGFMFANGGGGTNSYNQAYDPGGGYYLSPNGSTGPGGTATGGTANYSGGSGGSPGGSGGTGAGYGGAGGQGTNRGSFGEGGGGGAGGYGVAGGGGPAGPVPYYSAVPQWSGAPGGGGTEVYGTLVAAAQTNDLYGGGANYGGGSGNGNQLGSRPAGKGAVRIIWPGNTRYFPSTNVQEI